MDPATATPSPAAWLREGLRASIFRPPRTGGAQARPRDLAFVVLLGTALELVLGRFEVAGPAEFSLQAWLASWWALAAMALLVWGLLGWRQPAPPVTVGTWFTLWLAALLPSTVVAQGLQALEAHGLLPPDLVAGTVGNFTVYLGMLAWLLAISWWLARHLGVERRGAGALAVSLLGVALLSASVLPERAWRADSAALAQAELERPRLELTQEAIEAQQQAWQQRLEALAPQRPGVVDVYGVVFAPYADEDVFLRESTMVAGVLAERFDAQGRVLQLVNHHSTNATHPWATPINLKRAVEALAGRMDRDEDLLVVYLTSHGARDFQLAASHWPLTVPTLSPSELRVALDEAGIRHRVVAISACYSGGWIGPLASEGTLVMTAADADHTSYGCGRLSELTFFGRAVFDEQLRRTRSFTQAFAAAVPVIRQREVEAGKPDGFSNPQISVGEQVKPVLQALQRRLEAGPAKP